MVSHTEQATLALDSSFQNLGWDLAIPAGWFHAKGQSRKVFPVGHHIRSQRDATPPRAEAHPGIIVDGDGCDVVQRRPDDDSIFIQSSSHSCRSQL